MNVFHGLRLPLRPLISPSIMLIMKGLCLIKCPISFPFFDLMNDDGYTAILSSPLIFGEFSHCSSFPSN